MTTKKSKKFRKSRSKRQRGASGGTTPAAPEHTPAEHTPDAIDRTAAIEQLMGGVDGIIAGLRRQMQELEQLQEGSNREGTVRPGSGSPRSVANLPSPSPSPRGGKRKTRKAKKSRRSKKSKRKTRKNKRK